MAKKTIECSVVSLDGLDFGRGISEPNRGGLTHVLNLYLLYPRSGSVLVTNTIDGFTLTNSNFNFTSQGFHEVDRIFFKEEIDDRAWIVATITDVFKKTALDKIMANAVKKFQEMMAGMIFGSPVVPAIKILNELLLDEIEKQTVNSDAWVFMIGETKPYELKIMDDMAVEGKVNIEFFVPRKIEEAQRLPIGSVPRIRLINWLSTGQNNGSITLYYRVIG